MAELYEIFKEFEKIGKILYPHLNNSHSGNLSVRDNNNLIITRTGSMSTYLTISSLVKVAINGPTQEDKLASSELPLHRAVYQKTNWDAIVHTHPPTLIALSLLKDKFTPIDEEGKFYNKEGIKIVSAIETIGSEEIAQKISEELKNSQAVLLKGHGIFAGGKTLEDAAKMISSSEHSALIYLRYLQFKKCMTY